MLAVLQVPVVSLAPRAEWVETFFDVASKLDSLQGHLSREKGWDLRKTLLPQGDEEIRLWYAPTGPPNTVLYLRLTKGAWTAERRYWGGGDKYDEDWSIRYANPKSGWSAFWRQADELGMRTLPDDSQLPQKHRHLVNDGIVVYVEIQAKGRYRAYRYDNPQCQDGWPDAKRMADLLASVENEFPRP